MFEGNCGTICQNQGCSQKKRRKQSTLEFCIKISHLPKGYNWPETLQKQGVVERTLGLVNEDGDTDDGDTTGNEGVWDNVTGGVRSVLRQS